MKTMSSEPKGSIDDLIYCHLYGVVGDWYISEISVDRKIAFGFQIINSEPVWEMDNWVTKIVKNSYIKVDDLYKGCPKISKWNLDF